MELKTAVSTILNRGDDRAILTLKSTTDALSGKDIPWNILPDVRHIHIVSYFLMKKLRPYYNQLIKKLKEYGATVSIDTNWDPYDTWDNGLKDILPLTDVYFGNENEAVAISSEKCLQDAVQYLGKIIPVVVIKKGINGAEAYLNGEKASSPSIPGEKADAVGAGDSFDAGFLYGYLKGMSIEECLIAGNVCGSLTTRYSGGTRGQPALAVLRKFMDI
jgi:sugar/nucleoside kinase (ribokinase family)